MFMFLILTVLFAGLGFWYVSLRRQRKAAKKAA
jgi:preprotein translocase subunit YajC